jgi:putative hydrolase
MDNITIAYHLRQYARQLDLERGNLLRIRAYRRAAESIEEMEHPMTAVFQQEGRTGLKELPHIGWRIARAIESLICTGNMPARRSAVAYASGSDGTKRS